MDRRESFIYDGAGLLADAAGSIHIAGPNGALNQAGWTDQMILSFTDADADGSQSPVLAARNLYGPAVDQIFATEGASGSLLWSLSDHQGTPRDWATRSSSTGTTTIAQHTRYTAFGAIASIVDGTGNPLAATAAPLPSFTGQLYDVDSGLMYYRARWYDPQLGKFLNDDPMGFGAGDTNLARLTANQSVSHVDPTGLSQQGPQNTFGPQPPDPPSIFDPHYLYQIFTTEIAPFLVPTIPVATITYTSTYVQLHLEHIFANTDPPIIPTFVPPENYLATVWETYLEYPVLNTMAISTVAVTSTYLVSVAMNNSWLEPWTIKPPAWVSPTYPVGNINVSTTVQTNLTIKPPEKYWWPTVEISQTSSLNLQMNPYMAIQPYLTTTPTTNTPGVNILLKY